MYAIVTKYLPATDTRGARITAWGGGLSKRVTIPYPHELSGEFAHREAAMAFVKRNGFDRLASKYANVLAPGVMPDGEGYVYVWCAVTCERGYGDCEPFRVTETMADGYYAVPAWARKAS